MENENLDAYYNEMNYSFCPVCGGTQEYMGVLGHLLWLRCIDCGMESNIRIEKEFENDTRNK